MANKFTSMLFAFDTPGEIFTGAGLLPSHVVVGGIDTYSLPTAIPVASCGMTIYSQAIHLGFPPFALSNAQDLVIGAF